jgi:hypothetical protein
MRNSNQILQFFLNHFLKATKQINSVILEGKKLGRTDREILFNVTIVLIELENDLKEEWWFKIECFFDQHEQKKLPQGIVRVELKSVSNSLIFLN